MEHRTEHSDNTAIVRMLDEFQWRTFVEQHSHGNIFHTPEMLQVFECARHHRPEFWAAVDSSGKLQALFTPVQVGLRHRFLSLLSTRAIAYGGVLCAPTPEGQAALQKLLTTYRATVNWPVLYAELRHLSDIGAIEPALRASGFVFEEHLDYLINLAQTPDDLLKSIGPRTRKKIRQGLRKGDVHVRQVTDKSDVAKCYKLFQQSYAQAGVPLAHQSLFDAAFDILHPRGMCTFWLASVNGTDVAASVELPYKGVIYGWYGGVDRRFSEYLPGELLMWHVLTWGIKNGYRIYDFGGAGKPGEKYGVRDFKAKFGGQLVTYGRHRLVTAARTVKFLEKGLALYQGTARSLRRFQSPTEIPERGEA